MSEDESFTYCRLCLQNLNKHEAVYLLEPVLTEPNTSKTLFEKIDRYLPAKLNPSNELSFFICFQCKTYFEDFEQFIERIVQNQIALEQSPAEVFLVAKPEPIIPIKLEPDPDEFVDENHTFEGDNHYKAEDELLTNDDYESPVTRHICGQSSYSAARLKLHISMKHGQVSIEKEQTTISIRKKPDLKTQSYQCDICKEMYLTKIEITKHIVQTHKEPQTVQSKTAKENAALIAKHLKCDICNDQKLFSTFKALMMHFQAEHKIRGYVKCCSKKFYTRSTVVKHEKVHMKPNDFKCHLCGRITTSIACLRDHISRHGSDADKKYPCSECHKKFHNKHDLRDHFRKKHVLSSESVECDLCKKSLTTKVSLYLHMKRFHLNEDKPICDTCGKTCLTPRDLVRHIQNQHLEKIKKKCDQCGIYVKNMGRHKRIHVESALDLTCDICGHKTTTHKNLRDHKKVHTDERPFECTECGQKFKRKTNLEDHVNAHKGTPQHFCKFCDRSFYNSGNKFKHIKQAHPEQIGKQRKLKVVLPNSK